MDPSYAMAKFRMESKDILRSKQKGCWYYLKYFFFFLSIIQFLIILGLVLFMLYGNAHVGTEVRLKSVENRYKNLTLDHIRLNDIHSQLKTNFGLAVKEKQNCTNLLNNAYKAAANRTAPVRYPLPTDLCKGSQLALDRLNLTCTHERLLSLQYKLNKEREFDNLKDYCTKNISLLTTRELEVRSEKETFQKQTTDLRAQLKVLKDGCTTIDVKFTTIIDQMRANLDITHQESWKCRSLPDAVTRNIEGALQRLRQEVNNVILENSQLKVNNDRLKEEFEQCKQEKDFTIREKSTLANEKGAVEKQLAEKSNELAKLYTQYIKKEEELETCRRVSRFPSMTG